MFPPARPTSVGNQSVMCSRAVETRLLRLNNGLWTNATPRTPPSQYVPWRHSQDVQVQLSVGFNIRHHFYYIAWTFKDNVFI